MAATRRRRIVRRAVMALAWVVLPPVAYVSAWLAVSRASDAGIVTDADYFVPVFHPLIRYADSDLPGATALRDLWWLANRQNLGSRWIDLHVLGPEILPSEWMIPPGLPDQG